MLQLYREEPNWNFPYWLGGFLIGGLFEVFRCDCAINFIERGGGLGNDHRRRLSNPLPPPQSEIPSSQYISQINTHGFVSMFPA